MKRPARGPGLKKTNLSRVKDARWHAERAAEALARIVLEDDEGEKLTAATKALRSILSLVEGSAIVDVRGRVRGIARRALKDMGLDES